eukprot:1805302-Amphidinium_carterae.1
MKEELKKWGLAEEQAGQLTMYLGGHISAIHAAMELAVEYESVDITEVRAVASAMARVDASVSRLKTMSDVQDSQSQWQLMTKLAESGWVPIQDHRADEVQDLVHGHIAFLVTGPFREHVLPLGVNLTEARKHHKILLPTSKMVEIALRDRLCLESWQKGFHDGGCQTNIVFEKPLRNYFSRPLCETLFCNLPFSCILIYLSMYLEQVMPEPQFFPHI